MTLALHLASLSTEGDFGRETLQEVANTLTDALREKPQPDEDGWSGLRLSRIGATGAV